MIFNFSTIILLACIVSVSYAHNGVDHGDESPAPPPMSMPMPAPEPPAPAPLHPTSPITANPDNCTQHLPPVSTPSPVSPFSGTPSAIGTGSATSAMSNSAYGMKNFAFNFVAFVPPVLLMSVV
jgi:hypothetical protein